MNTSPRATWKKNNSRGTLIAAGLFFGLSGMCATAEQLASPPNPTPDSNLTPTILSALNLNGVNLNGVNLNGLNLNGSVRGSYWNISRNPTGRNDFGVAELWLKASPRLGENASVRLEGWTRTSNAQSTDNRLSLLREAYLEVSSGAVDFRIGKQIIVWGKADQLNPTDNLSPRDNTLLTAESDDQRFGTVAAKANYNFSGDASGLVASAIWLPRFQPNIQPIASTTGITFSENIPDGDQVAFKLEQSGKAIDWSASYFRGYDLNSDISLRSAMPGALDLLLQHHRVQVLGADAATVLGRYGLRAEAAYTRTEDAAGSDPTIKNPFFYGVLGADRTFFEYLNINLQYYARRVSAYRDPQLIADPLTRSIAVQHSILSSQQDKFQQGISVRIANKWLHETLEAELAAVYNHTRRDYLLRPKLAYAISDHWKATLAATLFRGDANTFFGALRERSSMLGEIRYSF